MAVLIYDGECPFCTRYADYVAIKKRLPDLELLDARAQPDHAAVREARAKGLIIDEGMLLIDGEMVLHGAEALAALSAPGSMIASPKMAQRVYPFMRSGRNLILRMLGRKKMGY